VGHVVGPQAGLAETERVGESLGGRDQWHAVRAYLHELGGELAAAGAEVHDDPDRVVGQREQRPGERRPGGAVGGRREVRRRPPARDVETSPSGIQRVVPRLAPGNGIHASGL
jgi:hypothetical protein